MLAKALRSSQVLNGTIRSALLVALRADRPIRTVGRLALSVGRDRGTLARLWRQSVPKEMGGRLEDFLSALVLLEALQQRSWSRSWASVARQIGVHPKTLQRISRERLGRSLSQLDRPTASLEITRVLANWLQVPIRPPIDREDSRQRMSGQGLPV